MESARERVVARYSDTRVVKGYAVLFHPEGGVLHLSPPAPAAAEPVEVRLADLKAVFFVRDFAGDPRYRERKTFTGTDQPVGRRVEVSFQDGEVLVGSTRTGYEPERPGFFFTPADPQSNNQRVFALSQAIHAVRYL
jgi:hypothetical protein